MPIHLRGVEHLFTRFRPKAKPFLVATRWRTIHWCWFYRAPTQHWLSAPSGTLHSRFGAGNPVDRPGRRWNPQRQSGGQIQLSGHALVLHEACHARTRETR